MGVYNLSTRSAIADMVMGLHVQTPLAGLLAANFTIGAQTELFDIRGRIAVMQLFIELNSAADANATLVAFNTTFTVPVIALNAMTIASASIASIGPGGRFVYVGGVVGTAPIVTDSAGLTDVETAGKKVFLGGIQADGSDMIGTIGLVASVATQGATISGNAHLFYVPMSPGAYAESAL